MYDAIIVGAGPVGLFLASALRENNIIVIEKKPKGRKVCSGLVSTRIEEFFPIKKEFIENRINGAVIHFGNKDIELKKPAGAYVINRAAFDTHLKKVAKSQIIVDEASDIEIEKDHIAVNGHRAKILIGCDGANSIVGEKLGFFKKEVVSGVKIITKEKNFSDFVEMWFDKKITKSGFLWKIPRGRKTEYGGMGCRFSDVEEFFGAHGEKSAAPIPIGPCKSYSDRVLLAGDAAGQVKPWSGGGLIYGLIAAKIAADVVRSAIEKNNFSNKFLKQYEERWKAILGRGIRSGLLFRWCYKNIPLFPEMFFGFAKKTDFLNRFDMDMLNR